MKSGFPILRRARGLALAALQLSFAFAAGDLNLVLTGEEETEIPRAGSVALRETDAVSGTHAFRFESGEGRVIPLPGSQALQEAFTLSAYIKVDEGRGNMRLFSNYPGRGPVAQGVVLVDLLQEGGGHDLRLLLHGRQIRQSIGSALSDGAWHHVAVVFSAGDYALMFDGKVLESGKLEVKQLSLSADLQFGEDLDQGGNEPFTGWADDITVLDRATPIEEITEMVKDVVKKAPEPNLQAEDIGQPVIASGEVQLKIDFSAATDVAKVLQQADGADVAVEEFAMNPGDRRWGVAMPERKAVKFVTRPFSIQGGEELLVDADVDGAAAYLSIAVLDADGRELPGYGYRDSLILLADAPDQVVTWNSHRRLPERAGEIQLQVSLYNATIFAVKTRKVVDSPPTPLQVGMNRQLFADPAVIGALGGGAEVRLHSPENRGVVLTLDKPWEGNTSAYMTVLKVGDEYRLYYRGLHHEGRRQAHPVVACVAISDDGIHWTRPNLGQVEFEGSKDNNIMDVGRRLQNAVNLTPFVDMNPEAKPEEKYKAIAGEGGQAFGYTSPDGLTWTMLPEPFFTNLPLDSQQTVFFDPESGLYHAYIRVWHLNRGTAGIRGIMRSTSEDFRTWSTPEWLTYPDAVTANLYTNNVLEYPRAPQLFLGFPCRIVQGDNVEPLFMVSRDGLTFKRWDETIIRAGRNPRQWGNRSNYLWYGMVETAAEWPGETELSMYTGEEYYRGEAIKLRRYTYRPDGFVSINAPLAGGTVTTEPMIAGGSNLHVNYATSAGGSLEVEVLDESGRVLGRSRRMVGDDVDAPVPLGNARIPAGTPIRLRFRLSDADIYAFRFSE